MQKQPKRKLLHVQSLMIGLAPLIVFSCAPVSQGFCPSVVRPSDSARAWLSQLDSPPPSVVDYFNRIGDQQETIEKVCRP